jgi:hypothetical protein
MSPPPILEDPAPRDLHYLRIAFSAVCGVFCLLLILLWGRSLSAEDRLTGHFSGSNVFRIYSSHGCLVYYVPGTPGPPNLYAWQFDLGSTFWLQVSDSRLASVPQLHLHSQENWITLPYWLLVGLCVVLTVAPWFRWRFSLLTLLIAITLVAVGLGLIVAAAR